MFRASASGTAAPGFGDAIRKDQDASAAKQQRHKLKVLFISFFSYVESVSQIKVVRANLHKDSFVLKYFTSLRVAREAVHVPGLHRAQP